MAAGRLWADAYRPNKLADYVFKDETLKKQLYEIIKNKSFGHLLFGGSSGTGKTTLAKVLINECDVHELDVLEINASRTNSVDDIRDTITNFVQTIPYGEFKVVLLDEADFLSINAQAALRGVLEAFHETARFLFTCNFPHKVIPAIHSRCQTFIIDKLDMVEYTAKVATILVEENVQIDLDTLDTYVKAAYPDLRKCINMVQMNSINGVLQSPDTDTPSSSEYRLEMVELFKKGKIAEARKLICANARPEEFDDIYRWCYTNINLFGDTSYKQDDAILIIKQALVDHTICIDPEINFSACMIKLARNFKE